jgi:hypothetical protein
MEFTPEVNSESTNIVELDASMLLCVPLKIEVVFIVTLSMIKEA